MDFSLLRPFDLEAAKRGEAICFNDGDGPLEYLGTPVAGDRKNGDWAFRWVRSARPLTGNVAIYRAENIRMAPLCWVEGRPVYKGAKLWAFGGTHGGRFVTAKRAPDSAGYLHIEHHSPDATARIDYLTWEPPKVKREGWVNIYPGRSFCVIQSTEERANRAAEQSRIACVRIEWEEPTAP